MRERGLMERRSLDEDGCFCNFSRLGFEFFAECLMR